MMTQEELNKIIAKDLAIEHLPVDTQNKIFEKLGENIMKRVALVVMEKLPEDARAEFDAVSASGDETKVQEFLTSKIPNLGALIQESIQSTIDEFKTLAGIGKK